MSEPRPIPLSLPWFEEREEARVREALRGRVAGDGPFCRKVERRLAEMLGAPRVLLTTSCTHALELALLALGIGPGQEVLCPSFTFVSTANAVLRVGARPVFVDIEDATLGLDPLDSERRLTPRTTAMIPVHYAGYAAPMPDLLALARRHGLKVVEDAAQGLGASLNGRPLGTEGDAGCFSFHETKNLTCGEGGALALRDETVARRAEIIREKGTNRGAFLRGEVDKYTWVAEGSSYVLSDVLAAILDAQLDKAGEIAERRSSDHIFHLLLPDEAARDRCVEALRRRGVLATFHYVPLHSSPKGRALGAEGAFPVSERVARTLLRLPLHPLLGEDEVERVVDAVRGSLA